MTPIVVLCGKAGSGKDTVAKMLGPGVQNIAFADPIKRLVCSVFDFKVDLWGPSELRSASIVCPGGLVQKAERARIDWLYEFGPLLCKIAKRNFVEWCRAFENKYSETEISVRFTLQDLGTYFRVFIRDSIWVEIGLNRSFNILEGRGYSSHQGLRNPTSSRTPAPRNQLVCITDGRFRNEILSVLKVGGRAIKVTDQSIYVTRKDQKAFLKALDSKQKPNRALKKAMNLHSSNVLLHESETQIETIPDFWFDGTVINDKSKGYKSLQIKVDSLAKTLGLK
jgi:ribosomal protein L24